MLDRTRLPDSVAANTSPPPNHEQPNRGTRFHRDPMKIYILQKIARMVEGEFIFVQAIAAFVDAANLEEFLRTYRYSPTESFNGVDCIVELGTVQVEVQDADQFFGTPHPRIGTDP